MPKLRPEAGIAGKIRQSIRILEARIRKINSQNHRADKLHFIQRFPKIPLHATAASIAPCRHHAAQPQAERGRS